MLDFSHIRFHAGETVRPVQTRRVSPPVSACRLAARPENQQSIASQLPLLVLQQAGLHPAAYRSGPLDRRVSACLRALRVDSEESARGRLSAHPRLVGLALNTLLIGVSSFFRDAAVFDAIRAVVVPALGGMAHPVRIASVGCSNGAELYSMAILLAEAGLLDRAELLGMDCRAEAVAEARSGLFASDALAGMTDAVRSTYFERVGSGWRVIEAARRRTVWQVLDATKGVAGGPWDLILCRNLVIYLEMPVADALFRRLAAALGPQGFLVVGKAERPARSIGLSQVGPCVYRRHVV